MVPIVCIFSLTQLLSISHASTVSQIQDRIDPHERHKNEVAPFFVVKKAMVHFFVVKWPPNQIIVVRLKGDNGSDSDWKLVPNIIDKYKWGAAASSLSGAGAVWLWFSVSGAGANRGERVHRAECVFSSAFFSRSGSIYDATTRNAVSSACMYIRTKATSRWNTMRS